MAPESTTVAKTPSSNSPYQLDLDQVQRAADALLKQLQKTRTELAAKSSKQSLIPTNTASDDEDADEDDTTDKEPLWLIVTTKKHIVDKKRLKPNKMYISLPTDWPHGIIYQYANCPSQIPHSLHSVSTTAINPTRICLITADPQRTYKDVVASDAFPAHLRPCISRVIGISKLKAKYKSFESRRQLHAQHDIFLADDRIVTMLPEVLGKVFYKTGEKRPVPVELAGNKKGREKTEKDSLGMKKKKQGGDNGNKAALNAGTPETVSREIEKAINSALVHLSPSVTTAVKVAHSGMSADAVRENVQAVCNGLVDKFVPQGWRNVRSIHIKGPNSVALPVWLASELWVGEEDVLDEAWKPTVTAEEKKALKASKRKLLTAGDANNASKQQEEGPLKKRKADANVVEKPIKKAKSAAKENDGDVASRKQNLKQMKARALAVSVH